MRSNSSDLLMRWVILATRATNTIIPMSHHPADSPVSSPYPTYVVFCRPTLSNSPIAALMCRSNLPTELTLRATWWLRLLPAMHPRVITTRRSFSDPPALDSRCYKIKSKLLKIAISKSNKFIRVRTARILTPTLGYKKV